MRRGCTSAAYIANISDGTPGRATTVAAPIFIQMPGAVPLALKTGSLPRGNMACVRLRSGIVRPYTLLTVEDQIVYQAMVNVVAEKLFPHVRARYLTEAFGHLYAGKSSIWFYRKWSDGYAAFNKTARQAFNSGLKFTASFDLTAYYDSLDHGVLRHFLSVIGCDQEFSLALTEHLSVWTATERRVYHNHGIPQGPLGSGLLSEVVLQHFDSNYGSPKRVRYLRYVDDIRLFAASQRELREMIVNLDLLSKDVGLFPQSSKNRDS